MAGGNTGSLVAVDAPQAATHTEGGIVGVLIKRAKLVVRFREIDERAALAHAAFRAALLGGTHVSLIGEYVELHDLQNATWQSWNSEKELADSGEWQRIKDAEVLLAIIDKFGPIAFVLKL